MVLITGASGNVGREVLSQIALTGARLRAAYQDATGPMRPPVWRQSPWITTSLIQCARR